MIGKSFFICAFCSFLVLTFATFFLLVGAEDYRGQNPGSTSPRSSNRSGSSVSGSRAEDGTSETAQRDDEQTDEITLAPPSKAQIAGCVIGGAFGTILMYLLFPTIKRGFYQLAQEEEPEVANHSFQENGSAPNAPPPGYTERPTGGTRRLFPLSASGGGNPPTVIRTPLGPITMRIS